MPAASLQLDLWTHGLHAIDLPLRNHSVDSNKIEGNQSPACTAPARLLLFFSSFQIKSFVAPIGACFIAVTIRGLNILWVKLSNSAESLQMVFECTVLSVNEVVFQG
jgi:hypothetical protein